MSNPITRFIMEDKIPPMSGKKVYYKDGDILKGIQTIEGNVDNGKVLRVVDGAWAAASLPSASGVSF